ncbi:MAG: ABC transporter permease [Pseudomonadota bacterium]
MSANDVQIARRTSNPAARSLVRSVLAKTKLYWGLAALIAFGALTSPLSSKGSNIFLSVGNLTDILRQVSVTGIVAVGMTVVIFTAGIDLSVGSIMALGTVICAMLLTQEGWSAATYFGVPATGLTLFIGIFFVLSLILTAFQQKGADQAAQETSESGNATLTIGAGLIAALIAGLAMMWLAGQAGSKFGVLAVLLCVPCVGAVMGSVSGALIVHGRLQPFIVTLAMMVGALGLARVIAGQDTAVHPVYTGSNATEHFEILRSLLWGVLPVPGIIFVAVLLIVYFVVRFTTFGSYVLAIGGNEEASRLAGINVQRVKIATYSLAGALSALAGILYVAQFRQGKPDAGLGLELDAIAAVVIGGTSLAGGKGKIVWTVGGVLFLVVIDMSLKLLGMSLFVVFAVKGAVILLAAIIDAMRQRIIMRS